MKVLISIFMFLPLISSASCPESKSTVVSVVVLGAQTNSLTYCGSSVQVVDVLTTGQCSLAKNEVLGKILFLNDGKLENGHDCVTTVNSGDRLTLKLTQSLDGQFSLERNGASELSDFSSDN